jgi:hypothetical protein
MKLPTVEEARKLSRNGLLFVCATCPKMAEGRALGKDGCTGVACGSLISRKDFPEYSGSLEDFSALCFVCGSEDVLINAKLADSSRTFGLCNKHSEIIDSHIYKQKPVAPELVERKVIIYPRADRVLSQYREVRNVL